MALTAPAPLKSQPRPGVAVSRKESLKPPYQAVKRPVTKPQVKPLVPVNPQSSNMKVELEAQRREALPDPMMATPKERLPASTPAKPTAKAESKTKKKNLVVTDLETAEFASLITSVIVTLYVGPKRKQYSAHKDLLCCIVPWFSKALLGDGSERSETNEMYLSDHDPAAFSLFMLWLYRGKDGLPEPTVDIDGHINLYILAEKWSLTTLQNSLIDVLADWFKVSQVAGMAAIAEFVKSYGTVVHLKQLRLFLAQQIINLMTSPVAHGQNFSKICGSHKSLAVDIACQYCEMLEGVGGVWKTKSKIHKENFYV